MYFSTHNHLDTSNIRLLDSINTVKGLFDRAAELNLKGFCITDHECLSSHVQVLQEYFKRTKEARLPEGFKIGLGNEIYLTNTRDMGQKYYHFILIAKDATGHKQLRKLSSIAWYNTYVDRAMERVPTLKKELYEIVQENPGHLIATTACLGGELPNLIFKLINAENENAPVNEIKQEIMNYLGFCKNLFGDDFYIEVAPANNEEQILYNKKVKIIAQALGIKMIYATDSHYLKKEDRYVHKAYLNSKNGEREVDDFYEYSYMMTPLEVKELLSLCYDENFINELTKNTLEIADKIEIYSLHKEQQIPLVEVKPKTIPPINLEKYPEVNKALKGDIQSRYWATDCISKLSELGKLNDTYLSRLEEEADTCNFLSERIKQPLLGYFNTLQHYIDLFWECGSIVGPGRGSSVGSLSCYLQGITQIDPIEYNLPFFRFLNKDRVELPSLTLGN